jgi:hypothetical protein
MSAESTMAKIRSLKPNVTFEEAVRQFSRGGLLGYTRQVAFGPLRSIADFYIPFRIFTVEVMNRGKCDRYTLGLDMATGSLHPYAFEQLPASSELLSMETRNCIPSSVTEPEARDLMIAKVRRILFSAGFFRIRNLRISAQEVPGEIHIPYWAAFRGRGTQAHVAIMDAVRRRMEGGKVRHLLRNWLLDSPLHV